MVRFTKRIRVAWLIGLAALALTPSAAHGQSRSARIRQGVPVRQSPRHVPMTARPQSFFPPGRFGFDPFLARRFDHFEDRFERRFPFGQFDRFEDRLERRFGFDPFLARQFGFDPFLGRRFGFDPFLGRQFGFDPFFGPAISGFPFLP